MSSTSNCGTEFSQSLGGGLKHCQEEEMETTKVTWTCPRSYSWTVSVWEEIPRFLVPSQNSFHHTTFVSLFWSSYFFLQKEIAVIIKKKMYIFKNNFLEKVLQFVRMEWPHFKILFKKQVYQKV